MSNERMVAVLGAGGSEQAAMDTDRELGGLLASRNYVLVCGGLGRTMCAAGEGARSHGGWGTLAGVVRAQEDRQGCHRHRQMVGHRGIIPRPALPRRWIKSNES